MDVPQLLVLAGGFGTRLKKVVSDVPKPLAQILNKPFIYYFIKNWERQGIKKFVFLLHYNSEMIINYITNNVNNFKKDTEIKFIVEKNPLGTAGAIKNAIFQENIEGNFLVSNGDTWIESSLNNIMPVEFPSISVIKSSKNERFGSVKIYKNRIVSLNEKDNYAVSSFINAGIYHLHSNYFKNLPDGFLSIEKDFFPIFLEKKIVRPVFLNTTFIDIGIPEDFFKFIDLIKSTKKSSSSII